MIPLILALTLSITPTAITQYATFGDSLTGGAGASAYQYTYIGRLQEEFGPINNLAGQPKIVNQYSAIMAYNGFEPNIILLSGYNDMRTFTTLEMYRYYLDKILEIFASNGKRVYLGNCLKMTPEGYIKYAYGPARIEGDARVDQFNQVQREVAAKYPGVIVVGMDGYDPHNNSDGFHPNDAGYAQIAAAFATVIKSKAINNKIYLPAIYK